MAAKSHPLFDALAVWNLSILPEPFKEMKARFSTKDEKDVPVIAQQLSSSSKSMANNSAIIECLLAESQYEPFMKYGKASLLEVSDTDSQIWAAAELHRPDGSVITTEYKYNRLNRTADYRGCVFPQGSHTAKQLPGIKDKNFPFPVFILYWPIFHVLQEEVPEFSYLCTAARDIVMKEKDQPKMGAPSANIPDEHALIFAQVSHLFYALIDDGINDGLRDQRYPAKFVGGTLPPLLGSTLRSGIYRNATVLRGDGEFFHNFSAQEPSQTSAMTIGALKKEFAEFNQKFHWTAEERLFIPSFPDDMPVPAETIEIAQSYLKTRDMKTPMVNFLWRGITSFGKSTGVKMLACILDRPLLRQTCFPSMETQDFLSAFVPDNGSAFIGETPTVEQMYLDPEYSYERITGEKKENATAEDCLNELLSRSAKNSGTAKFKHVEANYVKALSKGYIIELSEVSRIREPGVLVGLDDYDQPGSVIPLVDGSYVKRHRDAICVMTDNVGYCSCRPVDPAVIRRQAFCIDSYEMPEELVLNRIRYNTGFKDEDTLIQMYRTWKALYDYCNTHEINEGAISMTELERWVQKVMIDGGNTYENCVKCVVAKATSNLEDQEEVNYSAIE